MIAEKNSKCYVCGPDNPFGLQVPYQSDGDCGSIAYYKARVEHGGWAGILHGGITFSLMDEAFGWALYFQQLPAVTARVETKFHKPVQLGTDLIVRAWVVQEKRRLFELHAEVRSEADGTLLAEADATMYRIGNNDDLSIQGG